MRTYQARFFLWGINRRPLYQNNPPLAVPADKQNRTGRERLARVHCWFVLSKNNHWLPYWPAANIGQAHSVLARPLDAYKLLGGQVIASAIQFRDQAEVWPDLWQFVAKEKLHRRNLAIIKRIVRCITLLLTFYRCNCPASATSMQSLEWPIASKKMVALASAKEGSSASATAEIVCSIRVK